MKHADLPNTLLTKLPLVATLLAMTLFLSLMAANKKPLKEGDAFPDLSKYQIEGKVPATLKGKVVVVDFWASWCGPCKESFPMMEELYRRFDRQGLIILAINVDESKAAMEEFLKQHPVTFNVVRDTNKKLVAEVNIASMPTSFVLDPEGKVHAVYRGFHGSETKRKYLEDIDELLKRAATEKP